MTVKPTGRSLIFMTNSQRARFIAYLTLSAIGLISAWALNGIAVMNGESYTDAWFGTAVDWVLSADLLIVAIAISVFMVIEARRIGMRFVWVYILLSGITAMAFTVPLFLAMRERHLAKKPD
jgi:uncharacterized membrane protein (UPF0182 family)